MGVITKEQAIDALVKAFQDQEGGGLFPAVFREAIEQVPTIDAVEVVRCKECKYYNPIGVCIEMSSAVCEDSFCCWAERRTDA